MQDGEIWRVLDRLGDGYAERYGTFPDQLHIGMAVALELEPERPGGHPPHTRWTRTVPPRGEIPGAWFPAKPPHEGRWWDQRLRERACRKFALGHWWHPADAMITWFCCVCGKERDGMPEDGR